MVLYLYMFLRGAFKANRLFVKVVLITICVLILLPAMISPMKVCQKDAFLLCHNYTNGIEDCKKGVIEDKTFSVIRLIDDIIRPKEIALSIFRPPELTS